MIEWFYLLALSGSSFGVGFVIVQIDVIIPVAWYGRKWKAEESWTRQIIFSVVFIGITLFGLFIAGNEPRINQYFPQNIEWIGFGIVTTISTFTGILFARLQLKKAPQVIIEIINAMFPPSKEIRFGASDVDAGKKTIDFIEKSAGTYKNALYTIANLFNSPLISWLIVASFRRFTDLTEDEQRIFVKNWYYSEVFFIRDLAHLFKALGSLGYYTDPRIGNEIGFSGPLVTKFPRVEKHSEEVEKHQKVRDDITKKFNYTDMPMQPKVFGIMRLEERSMKYQTIDSGIDISADVCIIGSGASGGILAYELSKNKDIKKIVLIERGSYYEGEDLNQRETDMISKLWKRGAMTLNKDYSIFVGQGETLGGTTVINHAICIDTPRIVLQDWANMGVSEYITDYASFQSTLKDIKDEMNVKYVPDIEINNNNRKLKIWSEKNLVSDEEYTEHGPNPRNTIDCKECGFSHLGCHYNSKQSTLTSYIPKAVKSGKCDVYCDCNITKIIHKENSASGIEGEFRNKAGQIKFKFKLKSKIIILAGGAINSSALLLSSKVPNKNKQIGKNLTIHPSPLIIGYFPNENILPYIGTPMTYNIKKYSVLNGVEGISHKAKPIKGELEKDQRGGYMLESVFPNPGQLGAFVPGIGEEHQALMKKLDNFAAAGILIRDTPKGIVDINKSGEAIIEYNLDVHDKKNLSNGIRKLAEIYFNLGAEQVIITMRSTLILEREEYEKDPDYIKKQILPENSGEDKMFIGAVHPQGGNIMGDDKETSVVDSHCQHHIIKNLFVCDASVFPTATGVNPMLTIMGIARKTGEYINKEWNFNF